MKIEVPKIIKPMRMAEYAPEFGEKVIAVWVNPPADMILKLGGLTKPVEGESQEEAAERSLDFLETFAELWNQGSNPDEHWSVEDLVTLGQETRTTDPLLWPWMRNRTLDMIFQHRLQEKKS